MMVEIPDRVDWSRVFLRLRSAMRTNAAIARSLRLSQSTINAYVARRFVEPRFSVGVEAVRLFQRHYPDQAIPERSDASV